MGSSQSSLAPQADENSKIKSFEPESGRGRKSTSSELPSLACSSTSVFTTEQLEDSTFSETFHGSLKSINHLSVVESDDCFSESESDTEPEEADIDDEEWEERLRILEDARKLKQVAEFFLHPEKPVESSVGVSRCFFDRPSAALQMTKEEADEKHAVLEDAKALKNLAVDVQHPEHHVRVSDPFAGARCYFSRPSAPESLDETDAVEREAILADANALKAAAVQFLHPERPVVSDGYACARNYFSRFSAAEYDVDAKEREQILADAKALKQLAVDFHHPEIPVVTSDPTACGRNYFARFSADEYEVDPASHAQVLRDAEAFKKLAVDYMHPERPVTTSDGTACGRNFFTRASAPEYDSLSVADARAQVMDDVKIFKQIAKNFLHPEHPVPSSVAGRNFFSRPSAPEFEDLELAEEKSLILDDLKALKQAARDYLHPELPVKTTDGFACGRNYFTRPSAAEFEDVELVAEKERALEDGKALKQAAVDYMHPEIPVSGPGACARNYFTRPSAENHVAEAEEHARILADAQALKKLAVDFMHPELPVAVTDPTACGRNFFSRPSAPHVEEDHDERERILADTKALKQTATDFLHPESTVVSDPSACGRNYFVRPSAVEQESFDDAEERARILADAKALKQLAVDYMHPERPVTGSMACARNFFTRPSAPDHVTEVEERNNILRDAMEMKKLVVDFLHPERPVTVSDPSVFGRNFFSRPSAPETMDHSEHEHVLAEVKELKEVASHFLHPEAPVASNPSACGRNYFHRPSAPVQESLDESEERARILADAKALKKLAADYLHPERPVVCDDPTATGRNYFDRPSSLLHQQMIHTFPPHEDDVTDHDHEHIDHFGMDEDIVFAEFRNDISAPIEEAKPKTAGSDVGSNLSRSPSSVMLFTEE